MPSDSFPAPKHQIPKWPFWLGDALLVAIGIALFFKQGAPMTPWAIGCIVAAIGLGAIIACAPYAIEHWVVVTKGGGDWAELRNQVVKLEFRLAEMELNGGGAPESARLAQSRYSRFTEDEDNLGVGEVVAQPKSEKPAEAPKPTQLDFGEKKGAALVGAAAKQEAETTVDDERDEYDDATPDEDLPTSLDDIGPAEQREPTHLNKALEQAKKYQGSDAIKRLIRNGKS